MTLPNDQAMEDVVAYIKTLPHSRPEPTLEGDSERGRQLYAICSACHGPSGEGVESLSSPALSGLEDWYIVAQLELFQRGSRGAHPRDTFGRQMTPIMGVLQDQQALVDLAVFIAELE